MAGKTNRLEMLSAIDRLVKASASKYTLWKSQNEPARTGESRKDPDSATEKQMVTKKPRREPERE